MPKKTLLALALVSAMFLPGPARRADRIRTGADGRRSAEPPDARAAPQISPDGNWVAYTVIVARTGSRTPSSRRSGWSHVPSGRTLPADARRQVVLEPAVVARRRDGWRSPARRVGDKNQVFVIRPDGGEAVQLTSAENGVGGYAWSPDGKQIAFTTSDLQGEGRQGAPRLPGRLRGGPPRVQPPAPADHRRGRGADGAGGGNRADEGQDVLGVVLRLVARQHAHRVQRHRQPRPDPGRHVRHLRAGPAEQRRQEDRGLSRARTTAPRWSPDGTPAGVLVGHGQPEVLPRQQRGWRSCPPTAARRGRSPTRSTSSRTWSTGRRTASTSAPRRRRRRTCSAWIPATGAGHAGQPARRADARRRELHARREDRSRSPPTSSTSLGEIYVTAVAALRAAQADVDDRPGGGLDARHAAR